MVSSIIYRTPEPESLFASAGYHVYGDQLVAVMNPTGAIQHEYFDGSSLDQVFADQTVLSGVLWPLEDCPARLRFAHVSSGQKVGH